MVDAIRQNPKAAFARINDINGGFVHDDVYVFVVGINDHVMYASGAAPRLVGRKVVRVTDISGKTSSRSRSRWPRPRPRVPVNYATLG